MNLVLSVFKTVSLIFGCSAIVTGLSAIINPLGFSRTFGMPIGPAVVSIDGDVDGTGSGTPGPDKDAFNSPAASYVSLMGARQLATGLTLTVFYYQGRFTECATILSILGIVVAGTDGIYLFRSGAVAQAKFHAIPGALIALLAAATLWTTS